MSWLKQDPKKALFDDMLWSKPENKRSAGKLLIIGGQSSEIINVSSAYNFADKAGAGYIRILMPDSLEKIAGSIKGAEFAPSNKSGSFAKNALASFFDLSEWAEHVLLAGDLGKNSETTVILDGYLIRRVKPITLSEKAIGSIGINFEQLINMDINLVVSRLTFQKICTRIGLQTALTSTTTHENMSEIIQEVTRTYKASLVISDQNHTWCGYEGTAVSTPTKKLGINHLSAYSAVWLMQNKNKKLEALASAVFELSD